jgi:cbb3-type cytochrome oxidase maturation protein
MSALLVLVPMSVVLLGIAIWAFFWATDSGQFDDLDTPGLAAIEEDAPQDPDERAGGDAAPRDPP